MNETNKLVAQVSYAKPKKVLNRHYKELGK